MNLILGRNGQGKTNLLEAIGYLATLKSFRNAHGEDLLQEGEPTGQISGGLEGPNGTFDLKVTLERSRRWLIREGKRARSAESFLRGLHTVWFIPDDMNMLKGKADARRRLMDRAIYNLWNPYLKLLKDYQTALRCRNIELAQYSKRKHEVIAVFGEQLADFGSRIIMTRDRYIEQFSQHVKRIHRELDPGDLDLDLRYLPSVKDALRIRDRQEVHRVLRKQYEEALPLDIQRGYTTKGPHHDDFTVFLNGRPCGRYASQGQLRLIMLSLKMAQVGHVKAMIGEPSLVLLDDICSELDRQHLELLFGYLNRMGAQCFMTATDAVPIPDGMHGSAITIAAGAWTCDASA